MSGGPVPARGRFSFASAVAFPLALYLATSLGFVSSYSDWLYSRRIFLGNYTHGVFRSRIVGREAVLAVYSLLHTFGIQFHTISVDEARNGRVWALFTAFVIVNGIAFLLFAIVLYWGTVMRGASFNSFVILVSLVAVSGYIVTPYDDLTYFLITVAIVVAFSGSSYAWMVCFGISVVGAANHESFLVATAAVAAAALTQRRYGEPRDFDLAKPAIAMVIGSLGTYLILKVLLYSGGNATFWQSVKPPYNSLPATDIVGVSIAVLGWIALEASLKRGWTSESDGRQPWIRMTTRSFLLLSIPYLVVSVVGGIWFEAPRLLMPVVIGWYFLRWRGGRWAEPVEVSVPVSVASTNGAPVEAAAVAEPEPDAVGV